MARRFRRHSLQEGGKHFSLRRRLSRKTAVGLLLLRNVL